jgi:hypothetical protein
MSLKTVTGKIDNILHAAVLAVCSIIWAVAGFPYLTEVLVFGSLIIAGSLTLWLTSRPQKKL